MNDVLSHQCDVLVSPCNQSLLGVPISSIRYRWLRKAEKRAPSGEAVTERLQLISDRISKGGLQEWPNETVTREIVTEWCCSLRFDSRRNATCLNSVNPTLSIHGQH
jgi:hypothetical protein